MSANNLSDKAKKLESLTSKLLETLKNQTSKENGKEENEIKKDEEIKKEENKDNNKENNNEKTNKIDNLCNKIAEIKAKNENTSIYIKEDIQQINKKLDMILDYLKKSDYSNIKTLLDKVVERLEKLEAPKQDLKEVVDKLNSIIQTSKSEIVEKLNIVNDSIKNTSEKIDIVDKRVELANEKISNLSEKIEDILENSGITVVDLIKLIREIYSQIKEIRKLVESGDFKSIEKAINLVDELNEKIDEYINEIKNNI